MSSGFERQTIFTPLGIRFWDPATDAQIGDNLRVRAWPDGATEPVRDAFRTGSGIYAFQGLPGLRDVEYPSDDGSASPPVLQRFVVSVEDRQRRFLPVVMRIDAPFRGIYPTAGAASPPDDSLPGFYLFSAPSRPATALSAVRADLVRQSTGQPAAYAVLELDVEGSGTWHGIADERGCVVVMFPVPPFQATLGSSPPGPQAPPQEQQWQVTARVLYDPANLETPAGAALPDLRSILTQAAGAVWPAAAGLPAADLSATLNFGQDLILQTTGLDETRLLIDTGAVLP
ncbi:MAG: hypothetical protein KDI07_13060 [Anaerolineae bacterium]|nr:hypothetical protein [Anaerolineae bacterium]MCB9131740.1 hypothetical protein [Anaerolineales bacterium]MCB0235314.1 hypothetical protein [Anaerolineae bacterium]MCB0238240.1 hypothetical protein [Anaerolineae bacterium]MCB0245580.1 hypothetical protein [Anaerolineae bacterium]